MKQRYAIPKRERGGAGGEGENAIANGIGNLSLGYNVTEANHIAIRGAIWPQY